jgi:alpha-L-rhamnosidase
LFLLLVVCMESEAFAQSGDRSSWNASWIAAPNDPGTEYGVYHFRKDITLSSKPSSFIVHVSADNRYKLYVNGVLVSTGPARGDLYNWNYETLDLAPYLTEGKNAVAALVWNEAQYRPEAIISLRTAFIVQGNSTAEEVLNTNESWKCLTDKGYQPNWGFFAASTGEFLDMNKSVMHAESPDVDITPWPRAAKVLGGSLKGQSDGFGYELVHSSIPARDLVYQRIPLCRQASGMEVPGNFPKDSASFTIPANTTVVLLLDQTFLTNAYPTLTFSKGKGAGISLGYAESLYDDPRGQRKGNRNEVEGKYFWGRKDTLVSNGEDGQSYTTLNFRTFRYIRLILHTQSDPLVINDIHGTFTGYPFRQAAVFSSADTSIPTMLDIGWRTARLNAFETYTDCPYYEQLQYIGDTRIQAMISYYYSGDDRLARNALNLMDRSRLPEGVTLSRYPTHSTQIISTFSLWYIGMLYDFWMYRGDSAFLSDKLPGMRDVLSFFGKYQDSSGSVCHLPYWAFVDWSDGKGWGFGVSPRGTDGSSAVFDLQLLWAYQWASSLEARLGMQAYSVLYARKAAQLRRTIQAKYWDPVHGLYADTQQKTTFSQHANALAILTGLMSGPDLPAFGRRLLADSSLTQCTIYFKYYLFQALTKAGLGNDYMKWLDVWRTNMKWGLTTWAEYSDPSTTRSDCHAWASSPNIEFFRTVLGIDSDAPGFARVKIEPRLGDLTHASGSIPHPKGTISVNYVSDGSAWKVSVSLPASVSGVLIWKGKQYALKGGENAFTL